MKRLGESPASLNDGERLLADLFEAELQAKSDPFTKRRIRARITQQSQPRRTNLKTAVVVGSLSLATAAAATVGASRLSSTFNALLPSDQAPNAQYTPKVLVPFVAPKPEPTGQVSLVVSVAPPTPPIVSTSATVVRAVPPPGEDPTLVASAIQALRNDHNPAQARQLLNRYLRTNPRGALAEDALALSIEAAAVMQDQQAQSLARTYLSAYPNGRHRKLAQRVSDKALEK